MKGKEILTDFAFGKVYLKIDRYTNNYINYLNFSTFIKPKNSLISNEIINASFFNEINKKSRFIVNMIVNNKIIKLNKTGKDNNDMNLNYESTEEEIEDLVEEVFRMEAYAWNFDDQELKEPAAAKLQM